MVSQCGVSVVGGWFKQPHLGHIQSAAVSGLNDTVPQNGVQRSATGVEVELCYLPFGGRVRGLTKSAGTCI